MRGRYNMNGYRSEREREELINGCRSGRKVQMNGYRRGR